MYRVLIDARKRGGRASVPQLAEDLGLNIETVRDHLKSLVARDLAQRDEAARGHGPARSGPGRPEIVYALTDAAEVNVPQRGGAILRELGAYLVPRGHAPLLTDLRMVIDPEIGPDIASIGLVYDVDVARITFTLTTRGCPMPAHITNGVVQAVSFDPGSTHVESIFVWDPVWHPGMITEGAW